MSNEPTDKITDHFIYGNVSPGFARKQYDLHLEVDVRFSDDVSAHIASIPKVAAQKKHLEDSIRLLLASPEYLRGKRVVSLVGDREGKDIEIGDPPTYRALQESYTRFKFGRIEPERGEVSPLTFLQIADYLGSRTIVTAREIRFNAANIIWNRDVPVGMVRWFYGDKLDG